MSHQDGLSDSRDAGLVSGIPPCTVVPACQISADIVLVSSDGHRFGTHTQNLGQFTGGFPCDIAPTNGEQVHIPNLDTAALKLFLQFVHHHRQPDLSTVRFDTLSQLAEAVEKYEVYSALEFCKVYMKLHVNDYPVEVFQYASKHNYPSLMNDSARISVQSKHLRQRISLKLTDPAVSASWDRYIDYWKGLFDDCLDEPGLVIHPGGIATCNLWRKFANVVRSKVRMELATFSNWENIIDSTRHYLKDCRHCGIRADKWVSRASRKITDSANLTDFTSFL